MLRKITQNVWYLSVVGLGVLILSTATTGMWILTGEKATSRLRAQVYAAISQKNMEWFDMGMPARGTQRSVTVAGLGTQVVDGTALGSTEEPEEGIGSGGLMAKFSRETDDVRIATTQTTGQLLQHMATCLTSLALALTVSWNLALVILASIPLTALVAGIVERVANPLLMAERAHTAQASGMVERVVTAIATVKSFNAQSAEEHRFSRQLRRGSAVYNRVSYAWGLRLGITSFILFSMFVQGFWYGSHLVQSGKATPGTVMTVFSAALLASNHLQLIVQSLSLLEKGKIAAASLSDLMDGGQRRSKRGNNEMTAADVVRGLDDIPFSPIGASPRGFSMAKSRAVPTMGSIRRIRPNSRCVGEINLINTTFQYPATSQESEKSGPAVAGVNMFFPAGETTFIVGGSGSGKSTIAQLILRLYRPDQGTVELDEQDMRYLDSDWCRSHIASVDQFPIIFDLSIHDNVALGVCGRLDADSAFCWDERHIPQISREQVIAACKMALLHDFIKDLPDGYDTILGSRGASLSGGQKQRLAIARARMRDPTILILDESTSALDPTARLLINEAVKKWRKGKTTLIITHDLSQVEPHDFLYMMKDGIVIEHGFRQDLEANFASIFASVTKTNQYAAPSDPSMKSSSQDVEFPEELVADLSCVQSPRCANERSRESNIIPAAPAPAIATPHRTRMPSRLQYCRSDSISSISHPRSDSRESVHSTRSAVQGQRGYHVRLSSEDGRNADQAGAKGLLTLQLAERQHFWTANEAPWLQQAAHAATRARIASSSADERKSIVSATQGRVRLTRRVWDDAELESGVYQRSASRETAVDVIPGHGDAQYAGDLCTSPHPKIWSTVFFALRSVPAKVLLASGLLCSLIGGGITPVFSYFLGKLLATMGSTGQESNVLKFSLVVLGLAILEGIVAFCRFTILELVGDGWIQSLRQRAFRKVLEQDKTWFESGHEVSAGVLVARIIKDAEDARNLVCRSMGSLVVVAAMIIAGLAWAMVIGWQLTLVGMAIGPIFVLATTVQARFISKFETRNKQRREVISKRFYELVSNIRGVRSLALEPVLAAQFIDSLQDAERDALRAAPFTGLGFGLGEGLTYLSEALIFYVGACFIVTGLYDFERMVVVFNLFIFAVTFAADTLAYLPSLSKSIQATHDLRRLVDLKGDENSEKLLPSVHVTGWQECEADKDGYASSAVEFRGVHFCFPRRPNVSVLNKASFSITRGEKVAIVGPSGCGKSTVTALLQRLYEPTQPQATDRSQDRSAGVITLGGVRIADMTVREVRDRMAVVSQNPDLFGISVADNVSYGCADESGRDGDEYVAVACQLAAASEFVEKLPKGYRTALGEAAALLSGGQRQRLAIARAFHRLLSRNRSSVPAATEPVASVDSPFATKTQAAQCRADLLILDEATSALDDDTRKRVLDVVIPLRGRGWAKDTQDVTGSAKHATRSPGLTTTSVSAWRNAPSSAIDCALRRLQTDVTTILITHKLDEMKRCDRIIVLEAGRVAQTGTFDTLMALRGGAFHRLATAGEWGGDGVV